MSMVEGWQPKKIGDIIQLQYGKALPRSERNPDGKYPVYGANGEKTRTNKYHHDKKSIIVGRKGSAGEINLSEERFWALDVSYFVKFDEKEYDLYFLYYLLAGLNLPSLAKGVKPGINRNDVYSIDVAVPPLPEQKRIVALLDEAFDALDQVRANAARNLVNAREVFESALDDVFANPREEWEERRLDEITTKIGSGATPRGGKKSYKTEGISLIRSMNVHDLGFKIKNLAFIDTEQADKLSNVVVKTGDVLLNITGASVARCCLVPDDILPARVNQHVSIIRVAEDEVLPPFLHYALISKPYKDRLLKIGSKGATRQAITKTEIKDFSLNYPSISEQSDIVAKLNALAIKTKELEVVYEKKIAAVDELKRSLLQKAFAGAL